MSLHSFASMCASSRRRSVVPARAERQSRLALETMAVAPMRLARLALPYMRAAGGGRIVNISSIYGRTTTPLTGWYQGAKHALEGLSDALRIEVASAGVAVVLVEPGTFKTGIWDEAERDMARRTGSRYAGAYRRSLASMRFTQPLMGDPARVAAVIGRALTAWYPRARYLVGTDAQLIALTGMVLPTAVRDRRARHGRKLSIIGWSLGGIYARELARRFPADVRQVITLASPFRAPSASSVARFYRRGRRNGARPEPRAPLGAPLPVPSSSLYSRSDGVVAWRSCLQDAGRLAENIEVRSSHCGMGHHPGVLLRIADRLSQPEGAWRPYTPPGLPWRAALGL